MNGYCIGIDFGGTFLKFGVLDGRLAAGPVVQLPTPDPPAGEALIEQMARGCRQALEAAGVRRSDVRAAGIGSPGPIDISAGRIVSLPNLPGLRDFPIRDRLAEALELPAFLENDANAAAYGEYIAGSGREARDMVFLTLGTGVGGGVVIDGRILHGAHDMAAELGHIIVEPDGESCGCGQRGCLERYCSATYLARHAERLLEQGRQSSLAACRETGGRLSARDVNEHRKAGDALADEVWQRAMRYLAIGCVSYCRIFDPDRIVIGGGLVNAGRDLMDPLHEHVRQLDWNMAEPATQIVPASLGSDAGVIGAAGVALAAVAHE